MQHNPWGWKGKAAAAAVPIIVKFFKDYKDKLAKAELAGDVQTV